MDCHERISCGNRLVSKFVNFRRDRLYAEPQSLETRMVIAATQNVNLSPRFDDGIQERTPTPDDERSVRGWQSRVARLRRMDKKSSGV